jgi:exosome complex RNA-binding protein Rrp42 (RNase PH superfamily)
MCKLCPYEFNLKLSSYFEFIFQILECSGNLFDAVSMAVKAALFATVIPRVTVTAVDGGEPELEVNYE